MTPGSPLLDLLVIGGLTIDRFADGSSSPGGAGTHVTRANVHRGRRIGIVTTSGEEPQALAGVAELRRIATLVEHESAEHSATFRHRDSEHGRRLWLEQAGGPLTLDPEMRSRILTSAILFAPVAGEIPTPGLALWDTMWRRGAILQGWLRGVGDGDEVRPLPLAALAPDVVDSLARFDLLVASREDMSAEGGSPYDQVAALRRVFGRRPTMIVTDGGDGLWVDTHLGGSHGTRRRHIAVPWRVEATSTVGAGDILAAFLMMALADGATGRDRWPEGAMQVVAEVLEERRG
jgi:hypothetical protein